MSAVDRQWHSVTTGNGAVSFLDLVSLGEHCESWFRSHGYNP